MKPFDAFLAVLGGVLSCLTPEALMLFPLFMAAAAAIDRISLVAIAAGLGLSLVLAGTLAVSVGTAFGFDAVWLRRAASLNRYSTLSTPHRRPRAPALMRSSPSSTRRDCARTAECRSRSSRSSRSPHP